MSTIDVMIHTHYTPLTHGCLHPPPPFSVRPMSTIGAMIGAQGDLVLQLAFVLMLCLTKC